MVILKKRTLGFLVALSLLVCCYLSYVSDPTAVRLDRDHSAEGRDAAARAHASATEIIADIGLPGLPKPGTGQQRHVQDVQEGPAMVTEDRSMPQTWDQASGCDAWGCTCQGLSDLFGTYRHHWGNATTAATTSFWMDHACETYPGGVTPATVATTTTPTATGTPTLHWFAQVCQRPHTSYVADDNPKRQGFCVCAASALCIGTWCDVVPNPDETENSESINGGSICDTTAAIPARPSCRSQYHRLCADCVCVPTEVAVAAWKMTQHSNTDPAFDPDERFVTYHHNGARMGNQFMTVDYAFLVALALNRTVYMRCRANSVGYKDKIGLQPDNKGLWDVEHLAKKFRIIYGEECGIPQSAVVPGVRVIAAARHPTLNNRLKYCSLEHFVDKVGVENNVTGIDDCQVLDLGGDLGIVWQKQVGFKDQFGFWSQLRPVSHIRDHVLAKMAAVEHTKPSFGIHHRNTVIEYFPQKTRHQPEQVVKITEKCIRDYVNEEKKSKWLNATRSLGDEEAAYMCTLKVSEIEKMLKVRDISITLTNGTSQKWFLLDDFSLCDHKGDCPYMQNALFEVGAEVMCPTPHWAMGWVCHTHEPFKSDGEAANGNFTAYPNYLAPIIDVWVGTLVEFYFGLTQSTFDTMICGMRGPEVLHMSNVCQGWYRRTRRANIYI